MTRVNRLLHSVIIVIALIFISLMCSVRADADTDYVTDYFSTDVVANQDNTYNFRQTIEVRYTDGITSEFQYKIPLTGSYRIDDIDVPFFDHSETEKNGQKVITIKNPTNIKTDIQTYEITYTLTYVEDRYNTSDNITLDLIPSSWDMPISNVAFNVEFPEGFPMNNFSFYTVNSGFSDNLNDYGRMSYDEENGTISFIGKDFPAKCGITLYESIEEGYFDSVISRGWVKNFVMIMLIVCLVLFVLVRTVLCRKYRIVPHSEAFPPRSLTPLEIGYYIDGFVEKKDITSMFFYLATRGYIRIHDEGNTLKIERIRMLDGSESFSTKNMFDIIFGKYANVPSVEPLVRDIKDIAASLDAAYKHRNTIVNAEFEGKDAVYSAKSVYSERISKVLFALAGGGMIIADMFYYGFHYRNSTIMMTIGVAACAVFLFLINAMCKIYARYKSRVITGTNVGGAAIVILYGIVAIATTLLVGADEFGFNDKFIMLFAVLFFIFGPLLIIGMRSRTSESAKLQGEIIGFRNYIRNLNQSKIPEMLKEDPDYFYTILPYAYVFGLTKKWASCFEYIDVVAPTWYIPENEEVRDSLFSTVAMNSMFDRIDRIISEVITKSR